MNVGLQVFLEQSADVPIVRVVGEVDLATAPVLRERLAEIPADTETVIVDLSEVTFLDSTGLSVLVASWKRLGQTDAPGNFRLVVNRPAIQRVLDVTGLAHVLGIFPSLEEAIKA